MIEDLRGNEVLVRRDAFLPGVMVGERLDHRAELRGRRLQFGEDHVRLGEIAAPLLDVAQSQPGHVLLRAVPGDVGAIDCAPALGQGVVEVGEAA
jgi:hypothetical protein